MFYLPVMYYPIQADDRATGFLLPTYGSSIVRGPSISNAFFWAINRSQDATIYHDWFTKRGQGLGGEYRYVAGTGSQGNFTTYYLKEKEATYSSSSGTVTTPAATNYEVRANVAQVLPLNLRARGNVDYFSSIVTRSTFNQNPYDWSSRTRSMRGNLSGNWGRQSVSASYDTTELFYSETASSLQGGTPRLTYSLAQSRIGETPLYYSFNSEYVSIARIDTDGDSRDRPEPEPVRPEPDAAGPVQQAAVPDVQLVGSYHYTRYSESYVKDLTNRDVQAEVPLTRSYWDLRTDIVGPKFTKVWDTPGNGYAEKYKHTIEPQFTVQRLTAFDDFERIVKLEGYDFTYGGTTRIAYGIVNRFTAKGRSGASSARTRDFLTVGVTQSYYSDPQASLYDFGAYPLNYYGRAPSKFSPIALGATFAPAEKTSISTRLDWDDRAGEFQSIRLNGTYALREWLDVNGGWSQRKILVLPGSARQVLQREHQLQDEGEPVWRHLRVLLRHRAQGDDGPAHRRVLQRAVLRRGRGVPAVQLPAVLGVRGAAGPSVQHRVHAGRARHVLELPGRVRRQHRPVRRLREPLLLAWRGRSSSPARRASQPVTCCRCCGARDLSRAGTALACHRHLARRRRIKA